MDNYKEKEYSRFVFTQYLREEQSQLFKVLDELQDSDRVVLLQAIIWSTQNFGPYFHTLDWTLGKYKRIKRKKHLRPFFNSWIGVRFDLFSLGRLIRIEDDNTSFDARLINARTWQDFVKAFILPWFQYPKLPKPLVLYAALQVISVKPTKRWWGIEAVNKIWRRMKYVGVRKEKKIWSEVIRTLSAHGFNEFREDLDHFAPLFIEVGGQKAIQETYEALRDIKTWWAQSD